MLEERHFRYRAFLSYSHRDRAWAKWLHASLESYRVDPDLIGRETIAGPIPKTLGPIFRDREDFAAGHSLTAQTLSALNASKFLIVVCSPSAAKSDYVNEEVRRFKAADRSCRVIPFIVEGEPGDSKCECFPSALRFKVTADEKISDEKDDHLAADARVEGDGKQIALQKTIAGLLGVQLDEIVRRTERARKRRNVIWATLAATFLFLSVAAGGTAVYAYRNLIQSEQRLDSAIEIAYGFVSEATAISDRFGVPIAVTLGLLRRAETALNGLIASAGNSPSLQYRRALMLMSLSDRYDDLGQTQEALNRAIQAREILVRPPGSSVNTLEWRLALIQAEVYSGVYYKKKRKLTDAQKSYRHGIEVANDILKADPTNLNAVQWLARLYANDADIYIAQNKIADALKQLREAQSVMLRFARAETVVQAIGAVPDLEFMIVETTNDLIDFEEEFGRLEAVLNYHQQMLSYHQKEASDDPEAVSLKSALVYAYLRLGNALLNVGKQADAQEIVEQGLEVAKALSNSDPENIAHKKTLALMLDAKGRLMLAEGLVNEALDVFDANLDAAKSFVSADGANLEWEANFAIGHERVGDALMEQGQFSKAQIAYQKEHSILSGVLERAPDDLLVRNWAAIAEYKMGEAAFHEDKWAQARTYFSKSLPFWVEKTGENKNLVNFQAYLFRIAWRLAELDADTTRLESAKKGLEWLEQHKMLKSEHVKWLSSAARKDKILPIDCVLGDQKRAILGCTQIIASVAGNDQMSALAFKIRGDAYRGSGNLDKAIADFTEAIRIAPGLAVAFNNRGLAYQEQGRLTQAIADYTEAVRLDPEFAIAYANRGLALANEERLQDAIADLSTALKLTPQSDGYNLRGVVLFRTNQLESALQDFDEAIQLDATNAMAHTNRGRVYERQRRFDEAILEHEAAIQRDPNLAIAYANLGLAQEGKGNHTEAEKQFRKALSLDPKLDRAIEGLARVSESTAAVR